jgi:hypothetical protein
LKTNPRKEISFAFIVFRCERQVKNVKVGTNGGKQISGRANLRISEGKEIETLRDGENEEHGEN